MKKITLAIMALALITSLNSCKESTQEEVNEVTTEMSEDNHGEDSHSHDDHNHDTDVMVGKEVVVAMGSKSGSNVTGTIVLTQDKKEVVMVASFSGFTTGEHAIHIHENGDCSSDDGKSAGGHWNPTTEDHGKWGNHDHHMGDIGNLVADEEGNASLTFSTEKWCIGCDDETKNVMGKSFIVHAKADDFESQPSGAAGAREACGVIQ
ncbi:superoxide dismutase family protein [Nonlabens sp.]|uniref:superoxide dismutase family protein n=1 Tax=Nonlabens sp. TaxID=1888209 RepID=UPI003F699BF7